ncbi:MAG: hypothetical protein NTV82_03860 [Candidatus Aminicenantes bacterium]|nr:hypothetical protein [Candidatus Aminicenantes bacterium]
MARQLIMLFPGDGPAPPFFKNYLIHIRSWWQRHKNRFSTSLVLSILFHTSIFGAIVMAEFSVLSAKKDSGSRDYKALMQALAEMESGRPRNGETEKGSVKISEADAMKSLGQSALFDSRISSKEKVQIFKKLLESSLKYRKYEDGNYVNLSDVPMEDIYALLSGGKAVDLSTGDKAFVSKPIGKQNMIEFYKLNGLRKSMIERLRLNEEEEKEWAMVYGDMVRVDTNIGTRSGVRAIPKEIYFRECPYEQMLAQGSALFSIIRGFPKFEMGASQVQMKDTQPAKPLPQPSDKRDLVIILYRNTKPDQLSQPLQPAAQGISFSHEKINQILDELMAMPEAEQFDYFQKYYLRRYDANNGDLAKLAREFLYNNLNSVFYMVDHFTLAFDFLEELNFKRPIYDYFPRYWEEHQKTKTGIEFLFCLADAYDFEKRTFTYIFDVYQEAKDVLADRLYKKIFNLKAKAYVLKEVYEELRSLLKQRGYYSSAMISKKYIEEEVAIYSLLAEMGGDVRNRALFALGMLYWDEAKPELAFETWRKIDESYSFQAYRAVKPYLARWGESLSEAVSKITEILTYDSGTSDKKMLERLLKYHKWKKRETSF